MSRVIASVMLAVSFGAGEAGSQVFRGIDPIESTPEWWPTTSATGAEAAFKSAARDHQMRRADWAQRTSGGSVFLELSDTDPFSFFYGVEAGESPLQGALSVPGGSLSSVSLLPKHEWGFPSVLDAFMYVIAPPSLRFSFAAPIMGFGFSHYISPMYAENFSQGQLHLLLGGTIVSSHSIFDDAPPEGYGSGNLASVGFFGVVSHTSAFDAVVLDFPGSADAALIGAPLVISAVPEPNAAWLMGIALLLLLAVSLGVRLSCRLS